MLTLPLYLHSGQDLALVMLNAKIFIDAPLGQEMETGNRGRPDYVNETCTEEFNYWWIVPLKLCFACTSTSVCVLMSCEFYTARDELTLER